MLPGLRRLARVARLVLGLCLLPLLVFATDIGHDARMLWVSADRSVFEVSPVDGTAALELGGLPDVTAMAVDQHTDHIWVDSDGYLRAFDTQGNMLVNQRLPYELNAPFGVELAVDGKAGNVWVGAGQQLYRFDLTGRLQSRIWLHGNLIAMTVDTARSDLWLIERDALVEMDQSGTRINTIDLWHDGIVAGTLAWSAPGFSDGWQV